MSNHNLPRSFSSALTLALACLSETAGAAWDIVPQLSLTAETDDNVRLEAQDEQSATRTALDARLRISSFSEVGSAFIEPRIVTDAYADEGNQQLESDDLFLRTNATRELPRANFEFNSDYRQQSVLRSEVDAVLDDDAPIGADGLATGAGALGTFGFDRERFSLSLQGGYELSDRTFFSLDTSWIDVAYDTPELAQLSDFESATLGMTLTRAVDDRNEVAARIYGTDYSAFRNDNDSRSLGAEATFARPLTETVRLELGVGVARTEFSYLDETEQRITGINNGFTFGLAVEKETETTSLTLAVDRSMSPSTTGFLAQRDDLRLSVRHRLTPRLRLSGGLRGAEVGSGDDSSGIPRRYLRLTIEMDWSLTPTLSLLSGYDSVREEFGDGGASADSNTLFVGIRFQGQSRQQ